MPQRIITTGEFDNTEIVKGINGMIDALKKAQDQGTVSAATLTKMQGAIDGVTASTQSLQATTGKGIAPSLNDGKLTQQIASIKSGVGDMAGFVSNKVQQAKNSLSALITTQNQYKTGVKELTASLSLNEKELTANAVALKNLVQAGKGATAEALALRQSMTEQALASQSINKELLLTKGALGETSVAVSAQTKVLKEAEKGGLGLSKTLTTGYNSLRKLAYLIPGVGIGGLVLILSGPIVDAFEYFISLINKTDDALELLKLNQANLNDVMADADKDAGKQIDDLKILYNAATDVALSTKDRLKAVKALKEEFPEYFKQISNEAILNGQAKQSYDDLTLSIIATSKATSAKAKLDVLEGNLLDSDFKREKIRNAADKQLNQAFKNGDIQLSGGSQSSFGTGTGNAVTRTLQEQINDINKSKNDALAKLRESDNLTQSQIDFLTKYVGLGNLADVVEKALKDPKTKKAKKAIEDIYQQELEKLLADIAAINRSTFTSDETITAALEAQYNKAVATINQQLKKKQLTNNEADDLKAKQRQLYDLKELKETSDFDQKKATYLQSINNQLAQIQSDADTKRIANIQDTYQRERAAILQEQDKQIGNYEQKRGTDISTLQKNAPANGIDAATLQTQINNVNNAVDSLIAQVKIHTNQALEKLSFDTFNKVGEDLANVLKRQNLDISDISLIDIQKQVTLFQKGKISYEQFQKALTKIAKAESDARFSDEKQNLQDQITRLENRLVIDAVSDSDSKDKLTADQIKQLEDKITALKQQLADATANNAKGVDPKKDTSFAAGIANIAAYASAINGIIQEIGGFWQAENDLEAQQLQRSIDIQNQRVDAARQIAAKGNAEYLRMEEDRQRKLQLQQANNAKRQIAINAALQASQLLVAITGAIASAVAATGPGAPFVIAGDIAAIIGALAAGYGLVKSLSLQQPTFYTGIEDTGRGGKVDSKGGFNAVLHPNERVINAEDNKNLRGLTNRQVIERVNKTKFLTENYKVAPAARLNMAAMEKAVNQPSRFEVLRMDGIERELKLNNHLQLKTHRLLKSMGVNVNVDRNGLAVSVLEATEEIIKNKKI